MPVPGVARHLEGGAGEPGGAHVLDAHDGVGRHQLETGLDQTLLGEGIAHLHGRPLGLALVVELGGGQQAGPVDAVAAGLAAGVDHRIADAGRAGEEDPVRLDHPRLKALTRMLPR